MKSRCDRIRYLCDAGDSDVYDKPEEMMAHLGSVPVRDVVMDASANQKLQHQHLPAQTVQTYPQRWKFMGEFPLTCDGIEDLKAIRVYRLAGNENHELQTVRLDMFENLNRPIEKRFSNAY